jgi:cytochrome P450
MDQATRTEPAAGGLTERIAALGCPVHGTILDPVVQDSPWDFYRDLHEQCPVFPMPEIGAVMVTRYDDVRYVLTHPELFSSSGRGGGTKQGLQVDNARRYQAILRERGWGHVETLQRTDPPVHTAYRRLVAQAFLPRRIKQLAPRIEQVCSDLIDALLPLGECEFHLDFAMPFPGTIIAEELGLDRSEIHRFNRWAGAMLALAMRPLSEDELLENAEIELEAQHHLAAEFERRRESPSSDLISTLVHAHEHEVDEHGDVVPPLTVAELQNLGGFKG